MLKPLQVFFSITNVFNETYITDGFGQTLGPDFKGETAGIVWSADRLDQSALASVSMGYQVGVTRVTFDATF